ncbi:MAG: hypothetical protein U0359_19560 [Byssovorax sp.]
MFRYRTLGTAALLVTVLASAGTAGCRRKKVAHPTTPTPTVATVVNNVTVVNLTLNITASSSSLTRITTDPGDEQDPAISPDGKTLLFSARIQVEGKGPEEAIAGADPETGARRTMFTASATASRSPAWLRDGSGFFFASDASGALSLVRSMAPKPNAAVSVVLGADAAPSLAHPSLSNDGKKIALQASLKGATQIITVAADGSKLTIVGEGESPAMSPDGKRVAFVRQLNGFRQVFLANVDGTNVIQVTSDPSDSEAPAFSPNGKFLLFSSNRGWDKHPGATRESVRNLFAAKPDGTDTVQLTDGDAIATRADWGKDGFIYFQSNQAGNFDIWRLRPLGELDAGSSGSSGPRPAAPTGPAPMKDPNPPAPTTVHGR